MLRLDKVLVPVDFSAHSRHAFRVAGALAQQTGAQLIVLYVDAAPDPMLVSGDASEPSEVAFHQARVRRALGRFHAPTGVVVEYRLKTGKAAPEILRAASTAGCDLIVMGSHGRHGLARLLLGSVAEAVVRQAPCPVLTVRVASVCGATRSEALMAALS